MIKRQHLSLDDWWAVPALRDSDRVGKASAFLTNRPRKSFNRVSPQPWKYVRSVWLNPSRLVASIYYRSQAARSARKTSQQDGERPDAMEWVRAVAPFQEMLQPDSDQSLGAGYLIASL